MKATSGDAPPPQDSKPSAMQYAWMFEQNNAPTQQLDALLRAIACHISQKIGDRADPHLTPKKLAEFYKAVGGNYDSLFVEKDDKTISSMWVLTGCQHTLQPTSSDYEPPSIPALTSRGFSRWESLEILLGPDEHVPFLQYAVKNWNLKNMETGEAFPPDLPKNVFPTQPDPDVDRWHEDCAANLWKEASNEELPRMTKSEPTPETSSTPKFGYSHVKNADAHPYHKAQRPVSFNHVPPRPGAPGAHHSTGRMPNRTPEIPRRESPPSRERERRRSFSDYPSSTTQENFPSHYPPPAPSAEANTRRPAQARRHSHPRPYGSDSSDDEEPSRRQQNSPQVPHARRYTGHPPSVQPSPNPGRSPRPSEPRMDRRAGSSPRIGLRDKLGEKVSHIFPGTGGNGRRAEQRPQSDSRQGSYDSNRDSTRARRSPQQRAPPSRLQHEFPESESPGSPGSDSEEEMANRTRARGDRERDRYSDKSRQYDSDKSRPYALDNELDDDVGQARRQRQHLRRPETHRRTSSHADVDRRRDGQPWDPRDRDRSRAREDRARWERRQYEDRNNASPVMGSAGRHYERAY